MSWAANFLKDMEEALQTPLEVSPETKSQRDDLVGAMLQVRRFFSTVIGVRQGRFGDAGAIGRAKTRYVKAIDCINHLAATFPPVERIF